MHSLVPETLRTARLTLRTFSPQDLESLARIFADPLVTRYLPRGPYPADSTRDVAARTIAYFTGHWRDHGFGVWAVVDAESDRLIGQCGLNRLVEAPEVEVLYLLDRPYWGRGLATEAAQAAVDAGFERTGLTRIVGLTLPENVASARVLQKVGLRYEKEARFFGLDVRYHALDADRWRAIRQPASPP